MRLELRKRRRCSWGRVVGVEEESWSRRVGESGRRVVGKGEEDEVESFQSALSRSSSRRMSDFEELNKEHDRTASAYTSTRANDPPSTIPKFIHTNAPLSHRHTTTSTITARSQAPSPNQVTTTKARTMIASPASNLPCWTSNSIKHDQQKAQPLDKKSSSL